MPKDPRVTDFLTAMRPAAASVTLVSTAGPAGRYAQTVSSMCSVTLAPPTLAVCISLTSPLADALTRNGVFGVSILADRHIQLAQSFAGRLSGAENYNFGLAQWQQMYTGVPLVRDSAAVLDCQVTRSFEAGTHMLALGEVLACRAGGFPALTYSEGSYGTHTSRPAGAG
ncbi:flavin reductase family protein [Streptomyces vinaceus]